MVNSLLIHRVLIWGAHIREVLGMTLSAIQSPVGVSASVLIKLTSGEYTAASVAADPKDAARLWLVKQQDGNYGASTSAPSGGSPEGQSSSGVMGSLDSLRLGGL
jgi:hypothetical protein